jgi:hypothetical protein
LIYASSFTYHDDNGVPTLPFPRKSNPSDGSAPSPEAKTDKLGEPDDEAFWIILAPNGVSICMRLGCRLA